MRGETRKAYKILVGNARGSVRNRL